MITRRSAVLTLLSLTPALAAPPLWAAPAGSAPSAGNVLSADAVLRDPEIPAAGNPDGDITVVEYSDFRCPYCKKVHPELMQLVKEDGNVRVVFKDWPILGGTSVDAARMVLASKYQGKYIEAHDALIRATSKLTGPAIGETLSKAGIDVARATRDRDANRAAIDAILARNDAQAKAFGFQGTPSFIVGRFRVPGVLDAELFRQAIKDAREAAKKQQ